MQSNPIVKRLMVAPGWPRGLLANIIIAIIVFNVGIGIAAIESFIFQRLVLSGVRSLVQTGLVTYLSPTRFILFAMPISMALTTIALVARDVVSEDFQMLRLTSLTKQAVLRGYTWVSLYRVRMQLALAVGVAIASVLSFALANSILSPISEEPSSSAIIAMSIVQVPVSLLRFGVYVWFGVALGLLLGLKMRNNALLASILAATAFILLGLIFTVATTVLRFSLTLSSGSGLVFEDIIAEFYLQNLVVTLSSTLIIATLAAVTIMLARRSVPLAEE